MSVDKGVDVDVLVGILWSYYSCSLFGLKAVEVLNVIWWMKSLAHSDHDLGGLESAVVLEHVSNRNILPQIPI